ncbi:PTS system, mannose-specific IIC component [Firmicutes bacterium M10-2]|nr:PTS system, mannose-specific IIC component [Firmicutes bacterium M10-2]
METLSITQSLIIALWVAAVMSRWLLGGATLTLRFSPLMTGLICGIVMNQVKDAMIVTAALQLIYMGVFSPGGSMPSEPCVAAAIAVPVALLGNLDATEAVAIAVPVGLLGGYLYQFRFFLNTFVGQATDRAVEKMDEKAIRRSIITYPTLVSFALYVPLIFISLYLGVPLIASAISALEGTVFIHILEVVGNGLAAIGIATTIYVIGRKDLLVFFFLAYFMSVVFASLNVTMVTYAVIGVIVAVIYSQLKKQPVVQKQASPEMAAASVDDDDDDYDDGF